MFKHLDENIDTNLKLIYKSNDGSLYVSDFQFKEKNHFMKQQRQSFADEMASAGLITRNNEICFLTKLGSEVSKMGGWLEYNNIKIEKNELENSQLDKKIEIDAKIAQLTKDKLEFEKSNRAQEKEIRKLTTTNLKLRNTKLKWYFVALVGGVILSNSDRIIEAIKSILTR